MQFTEAFYCDQQFSDMELTDKRVESIEFVDCEFLNCYFVNTHFDKCVFRNCQFRNCDLSLVSVDGCTFKGVEFEKSKLIGVNWALASWGKKGVNLILKSVDFNSCNLNYASFFGLN